MTIRRYRGDTVPDVVFVKDADGAALDISGFTFYLTVSSEKAPTDITNQVFQLTGVITDAPNGKVEFAPTAMEADLLPKKYFYDIQMVSGGGQIQTIIASTYTIVQDITKT